MLPTSGTYTLRVRDDNRNTAGWYTIAVECRVAAQVPFLRSDVNVDSEVNISDVNTILNLLFRKSSPEIACEKAADTDNSDVLDITDAVYLLRFLFSAGSSPPQPFGECGLDPSQDLLLCTSYDACR